MTEPQLTGESHEHKLAAIFERERDMREAAQQLAGRHGLEPRQIIALTPSDREHAPRALLADSAGIWSTLVRAHVWLGLLGFVVGLLVFLTLQAAGVRAVVDNPMLAVAVLVLVFTLAGLLLGGAVTVRPDQAPYIHASRSALQEGKCVLLVHGRSLEQVRGAREDLEPTGARLVATL